MRISLHEVRRIAALANLDLDRAAEERVRSDLDSILTYVEALDAIDTSAVPPAHDAAAEPLRLREDRPVPSLAPGEPIANAPEPGRGQFKVPRVITR